MMLAGWRRISQFFQNPALRTVVAVLSKNKSPSFVFFLHVIIVLAWRMRNIYTYMSHGF